MDWIGVATRLALQIGLHKESTYAKKSDAGCRTDPLAFIRTFPRRDPDRRLTQYRSVTNYKPYAGRPACLRLKDLDVGPPSLDFHHQDIQARIFVYSTKPHIIRGEVAEPSSESWHHLPEELSRLTTKLQEWLHSLPSDLQLYDSSGTRRPYYRPSASSTLPTSHLSSFSSPCTNRVTVLVAPLSPPSSPPPAWSVYTRRSTAASTHNSSCTCTASTSWSPPSHRPRARNRRGAPPGTRQSLCHPPTDARKSGGVDLCQQDQRAARRGLSC